MQRAAAGLASVCARVMPAVYGSRVVLLVGGGDNGGDALYAGARLARRGARVHAVQAGSKIHPGGLAALLAGGGRVLRDDEAAAAIGAADLIIDGLTGIGGTGGLREPHARYAALASEAAGHRRRLRRPQRRRREHRPRGGRRRPRRRHRHLRDVQAGAAHRPGRVHCRCGRTGRHRARPGPARPGRRRRPARGRAASRAGARVRQVPPRRRRGSSPAATTFTGAAVLTVGGAVRGGAGMVRFASVARPVELVRQRWPEAVTTVIEPGPHDSGPRTHRPGPGVGRRARPRHRRGARSRCWRPCSRPSCPSSWTPTGSPCCPAAATCCAAPPRPSSPPRRGAGPAASRADREAIEARRLEHVRRAAEELSATVLLKGSTTLVAEPDRPVRVNPTGTPRLATAGKRGRAVRADRRAPGGRDVRHGRGRRRRLPARPGRPPGVRARPRGRIAHLGRAT